MYLTKFPNSLITFKRKEEIVPRQEREGGGLDGDFVSQTFSVEMLALLCSVMCVRDSPVHQNEQIFFRVIWFIQRTKLMN